MGVRWEVANRDCEEASRRCAAQGRGNEVRVTVEEAAVLWALSRL
jgi:hypothetical protein